MRYISFFALAAFAAGCGALQKEEGSLFAKPSSIQLDAKSADAFSQTLYPVVRQNCSKCHGLNQSPLFAVSDPAASQSALVGMGLVDLTAPGQSRIVAKILGGHQGFPSSLANQLMAAITQWANLLKSSPGASPLPSPPSLETTYRSISMLILQPKCVSCHGPTRAASGIRYDSYAATLKTVSLAQPSSSSLYRSAKSGNMPPGSSPKLTADELNAILSWIQAGAPNN